MIDPAAERAAGPVALAIVVGALLGTLLAAANVYAGLKIGGFTTDGSIVAAILGLLAVRALGRSRSSAFSALHTNLVQTAASAGAFCAVAGLTNAVPAMGLDGVEANPWLLVPWVAFVALLGVCLAVPLRRRAVDDPSLRFPSGVACAELVRTLHGGESDARRRAAPLGLAAAAAGLVTALRDIDKLLPPLTAVPGHLRAFACDKLGLAVSWSPLLFAIGGFVGLRTALGMVLGCGLGTLLGGPWLAAEGIIQPTGFSAVRAWTVWPAVGLMTAGGLAALALGTGVMRRALAGLRRDAAAAQAAPSGASETEAGQVPRSWWLGGLGAAAAGAALTAWAAFGVPVWQSLLAVVVALPLAAIAIRAVGETDLSPSNNLAKTTQFLFAAVAPGQTVANVAAAGVASGCAIEASEVMTDLKSGRILGNRPRDQFLAQVAGVVVASGAAVAAYALLVAALPLGGDALPAPTAVAWQKLAQGLAGGKNGIPPGAATALWIAAGAGVLLALAGARWKRIPFPSPIAVGLGAIMPPSISITVLLGAAAAQAVAWRAPAFWEHHRYLILSGLIIGESLLGLLAAGLLVGGLIPG